MNSASGSDDYETAKSALQAAEPLRRNGMIVRVIGDREGEFGMSFLRFLAHTEHTPAKRARIYQHESGLLDRCCFAGCRNVDRAFDSFV
jgi:hypothetical protein